jgi:hypothetical protein
MTLIWGPRFGTPDLGTRIWGPRFGNPDLGTPIWGPRFGDPDLGTLILSYIISNLNLANAAYQVPNYKKLSI